MAPLRDIDNKHPDPSNQRRRLGNVWKNHQQISAFSEGMRRRGNDFPVGEQSPRRWGVFENFCVKSNLTCL